VEEENQKARDDFVWKVHSYISDYIKLADAKAGAVIAWCGGLIGVLFASQTHHSFTHARFSWAEAELVTTLVAVASAFGFILLGLGVLFAFIAIKPRLWSSEARTEEQKGYIYWGDITLHKSEEAFQSELSTMNAHGLSGKCADHTYVLSGIASKKYWWVNWSLWIAFAGSVFSAFARFFV
jgi:Family of unknown function (DUF5706)